LGAPGWRNSTVPFCSEIVGNLQPRVWSNSDSVYVLVSSTCNSFDHIACNTGNAATVRLYRNDGSGWSVLFETEKSGTGAIAGYPDGRVVLAGDGACPVTVVRPDGTSSCLLDEAFVSQAVAVSGTQNLFVLGSYSADPGTTVLVKHDGTGWSTTKRWPNAQPGALAAGASTLLIAGPSQMAEVVDTSSDVVSSLPNVPAGDDAAAWVYGANDILLGDAIGRVSPFAGSEWATVDSGFNDVLGDMWGDPDGSVFFYSQGAFGRWHAGAVE
jgi:hypothetical protein